MTEEEQADVSDQPEEEEEDVEDPIDELREKCSSNSKCAKFQRMLDECNFSVTTKTSTTETCTQELMDFIHCRDHCVAKSIFKKLK